MVVINTKRKCSTLQQRFFVFTGGRVGGGTNNKIKRKELHMVESTLKKNPIKI